MGTSTGRMAWTKVRARESRPGPRGAVSRDEKRERSGKKEGDRERKRGKDQRKERKERRGDACAKELNVEVLRRTLYPHTARTGPSR